MHTQITYINSLFNKVCIVVYSVFSRLTSHKISDRITQYQIIRERDYP